MLFFAPLQNSRFISQNILLGELVNYGLHFLVFHMQMCPVVLNKTMFSDTKVLTSTRRPFTIRSIGVDLYFCIDIKTFHISFTPLYVQVSIVCSGNFHDKTCNLRRSPLTRVTQYICLSLAHNRRRRSDLTGSTCSNQCAYP